MHQPAPAPSATWRRNRRVAAALAAAAAWLALLAAPSAPVAAQAGQDRAVTARGDATFHGSTAGMRLNAPLVGAATTPSGGGYWLLGRDGGIFTFGDARFHGSTGNLRLNRPVLGITADPRGRGYWTVASDGGVFAFGVPFHGSTGDRRLNRDIVGMAATPTGGGYWLVAADGGVFSFGDARFHGSTGDRRLDWAIVDVAASPDGQGYWLLGADGQVYGFGVPAHGKAPVRTGQGDRATSIAAHPGGGGYFIATRRGEVHAFGTARSHGDRTGTDLETIAIVPTASGAGYWLVHTPRPERRVVSSFTTPLVPGQSRNVNIHLAADYIDGTVISPGETWSLDRGIGRRTRERGFISNGFIDGDGDLGTTLGGGISQMGTTFVNAAWFAGIRIDDFRQHTIYFERYPMCREATLSWGVLDVVVTNDSPYDITVDTSYTSSSVTVALVSRPWAEVSSWTGQPYNVDRSSGAFSVRCGRTVTYPDGSSSQQSYTWRYRRGYPG